MLSFLVLIMHQIVNCKGFLKIKVIHISYNIFKIGVNIQLVICNFEL